MYYENVIIVFYPSDRSVLAVWLMQIDATNKPQINKPVRYVKPADMNKIKTNDYSLKNVQLYES